MNRRPVIGLSLTTAVALALMSAVEADTITIENPGFEEPNTVKITTGFDSATQDDVPGWNDGGTTYGDTGVESGAGGGHDSTWRAYFMGGDDSAIQLTDHTIAAGEMFSLTYWVVDGWGSDTVRASLYYDDGSRQTVATFDAPTTDAWVEHTLQFAADDIPASVGNRIGVEFINPTANWAGLDDVALSVVPEPSSFAICGVALAIGALVIRRRRG